MTKTESKRCRTNIAASGDASRCGYKYLHLGHHVRRCSRRFLDLALAGGFTLIVSPALLDELVEKLHLKFAVSFDDASVVRTKLESIAFIVHPAVTLDAVPEDPDDNRVLECAVAGNADVIVTGDRHLLTIKAFGNMPIVRVREFVNEMTSRH